MFNLIYKLKKLGGGTGFHAIFLAQTYPTLFSAHDVERELTAKLDNRIWMLHNPFFYKRIPLAARARDWSCIRASFARCTPGKHLTNGFSYFKNHPEMHAAWFPTIYQHEFGVNTKCPCVGYYARDARIESNLAFADFASHLPSGVKVVTMGQRECIEKHLAKLAEGVWTHTHDHDFFWRSCSHYFYFRPADIEDPLPHTLLEAIQSKHRIVSPVNPRRGFSDGIDDLLSCLDGQYDTSFDPQAIGVECCRLSASAWAKYLQLLCDSRFEVSHSSLQRCQTLAQWIDQNLLR